MPMADTLRAGFARHAPRAVLASLGAFIAASLLGLALVDAPSNMFRCLTPLPGASAQDRPCLGSLPEADRVSEPAEPISVLAADVGRHRDVYRALALHAPGATYSMFQPAMYFWATSPALMVTVGEAGDVLLFEAEYGREFREAVGDDLSGLPPGERRFDIAAGSLRYRGRFGPAPVTDVGVYQMGREVLFIDAALLPDIIASKPEGSPAQPTYTGEGK